ncbi:MAG: glycosyltransferase family 4 protein [Candidatus Binatia bacterium]
MPTLRILYDVDGWAYHHRARALQQHAPAEFDVSLAELQRFDRPDAMAAALGDEPDLVFVLSTPAVVPVRRALDARGWRSTLVGSWNAGWPLQIPLFFDAYRAADAMVINNATAWRRVGQLPRTYLLPNGVDLDVFRVATPLAARPPRVLWAGSERGRRRKGYDRIARPLQQRLGALGIDCELLLVDSFGDDKRDPAAMAAWYDRGTVLVCTSAAEGTPNPALEAAACGCTVVSTPVGNMPELIRDGDNGFLVERTLDAFVAAARTACAGHVRLATAMQGDIRAWGWDRRASAFFAAFRDVLAGRRADDRARRDLTAQVTAFVTTVGAPSYAACRDLLDLQDCAVRVEIIDRVAPMNAAFQRMLDGCATPYFVQVDEDMLLHPHAVRTLYERIAAAEARVAMVVGDLWDAHLDRRIEGVKIYRHAIVRRYPFGDAQAFEKLQARQMRDDGYATERVCDDPGGDAGILGLHGTHWTARTIYERYATLESRRRRQPQALQWFEPYPAIFLERVLEDPTELNLAALMGVMSSALLAHDGDGVAKDFRAALTPPGFDEVRRFYDALRAPPPARGAGGHRNP